MDDTAVVETSTTQAPRADPGAELVIEELLIDELLVEELSIDGMCGVY